MLFPNTHRNHMLPIRCSQPPCMNIEVTTVHQFASAVRTQRRPSPSGTAVPGGTVCSTSPGISPSWQTERAKGSGEVLHTVRSEEHTSELQSRPHLVCRLLLEKKKK